ncbi:hypothetical protein D9M71_688140 [compost metagenome]
MLLDFTGQLDLGLVVEGHRRQVFVIDLDGDGAGGVLELVLVIVVHFLDDVALQHHRGVVSGVVSGGHRGHRLGARAGVAGSQGSGAEQWGKQQSEVTSFHGEDPVWVSMEPDYPGRLN